MHLLQKYALNRHVCLLSRLQGTCLEFSLESHTFATFSPTRYVSGRGYANMGGGYHYHICSKSHYGCLLALCGLWYTCSYTVA